MVASSTKRVGRPTKAPTDGNRVSLGLRVTAEMKRRLDAAALKNSRSQSQEAEMRLARSFGLEDERGGAEEAALTMAIGGVFLRAGQQAAKLKWQPFGEQPGPEPWQKPGAPIPASVWANDPQCFAQACKAVLYLFDQISPPVMEGAGDDTWASGVFSDVGVIATNVVLAEILGDWTSSPLPATRLSETDRRRMTGSPEDAKDG